MPDGGTGKKFTYATTVVAGVASLAATLLSILCGDARQLPGAWQV